MFDAEADVFGDDVHRHVLNSVGDDSDIFTVVDGVGLPAFDVTSGIGGVFSLSTACELAADLDDAPLDSPSRTVVVAGVREEVVDGEVGCSSHTSLCPGCIMILRVPA